MDPFDVLARGVANKSDLALEQAVVTAVSGNVATVSIRGATVAGVECLAPPTVGKRIWVMVDRARLLGLGGGDLATKGYVDQRGGAKYLGPANTPLGSYQPMHLTLNNQQYRWGDINLTDPSGLPNYFRVSRTGMWRFTVGVAFNWAGDGMSLNASAVLSCGATNYIYGLALLDGVTGSQRQLIGVSVSGVTNYFAEHRSAALPTLTSVAANVTAEYLGPIT